MNGVFALPNLEGIQIYQKNVHLYPERKQSLEEDIYRYRNADDIWDVLRGEFALEHHESSPLVQAQIEWFMEHQDFLLNSAERAAPYLYYILQQCHKRHLPTEVVLLPIIESAFNPFAYSPAGAAGIWQMMPDTATGYGIHQDWWYDGRRDVITSTKAALNYLSYLASFFDNNWLLAFAAYDTGEGNVSSAIRKNIRDGYNTDFWALPLAQETRDYVPRLLALATIIAHPERYPVYFPPVHNAPYLAQIDIGEQIDLKHAASLAGMTLKKLMQLNPGYSRLTTSPNGPHKLVLPIESVAQFSENLAMLPPSFLHNARRHNGLKTGETLASISRQFNSSPMVIKRMSQQSGKAKYASVKTTTITKTVVVADVQPTPFVKPRTTQEAILFASRAAERSRDKLISALERIGRHYTMQPGDTIYLSKRGDNLDRIAKYFNVPKAELLASNPFTTQQEIRSGQQLIIPTHLHPTQLAVNNKHRVTF
jgi:membrane-bound lytic murein transglycosylase D